MLRNLATALLVVGVLGCAGAGPPPLDKDAIPKTTTSAEAQYISTRPAQAPTASAAPTASEPEPASWLPEKFDGTVDRSTQCAQKHCWRSWLMPRPFESSKAATKAYPDIGTPSPVAVWQERMEASVKLDFPRAKGLGMFGVVLNGVVTVSPSEGGQLAALETWGAFHAPGAGVTLKAGQGDAAALLVAYAMEGQLNQRIAMLRQNDKAVYWEKRPGRFSITDLGRVEDLQWASGAAHARLGFEKDKSPQVYLGLLGLAGAIPVADHAHSDSWEILVPVKASGTLTLSGQGAPKGAGPFPKKVPVNSGTVVTMPPKVHHAWQSSGSEPLVAVQLYLPPGPEQRFRDLATKAEKNR